MSNNNPITVERLECAIAITAHAMVQHNLPQILPTLKRLEAERDRLLAEAAKERQAEGVAV